MTTELDQRLDALENGPDGSTEDLSAKEASPERLNRGDGANVSRRFRRPDRRTSPKYRESFREALDLYKRVLQGSRWAALEFSEAMSTADFSYLFADILDRQLLPAYQDQPVQWTAIAKPGRVRDFRTVERFTIDGGNAVLTTVDELAPYPAAALTDGKYSYKVGKRGRRLPISWEAKINDDLDAFRDMPVWLGQAARFSEEKFATELYASSTGPNATFFASGNKNLVSTAKPLDVAGLTEAFTLMYKQKDPQGNPIYIDGVTLVVPPALTIAANNLIDPAGVLWVASGGGNATGINQLQVPSWLRGKIKVVTNPWLPIVVTSGTIGDTCWFLFADPAVGRPAMEFGRLIGHENPELFMKAPNSIRVGGGLVDPMEGDYDTDAIDMKVRHVFGGVLMDPKSAVASPGQ